MKGSNFSTMELFGTYENPGGIVEKSPLTQTTSDMDKSFEAFLLTSQAADEVSSFRPTHSLDHWLT